MIVINPIKLFSAPRLSVEWDDAVRNSLKPCYRTCNAATIPVRLFDLLKGMGSVQPRRVNTSWMSSMCDYGYVIDRLYDTPELKVKIHETRRELSSEMLTELSALMGMGLSVVVISRIFDIQPSTINKIKDTSAKRPDWRCLLKDNRTLLVEAKGSTSKDTSKQQLKEAVVQKNAMLGDVKVATGSLLNEDAISRMTIIDPPTEEGEDNNNRRHVYRANHYASVFSFLGEDVLSLYFEKMAKRLSGRIGVAEMDDKEFMYNELSYHAPSITIEGRDYAGHLYGAVDGQSLFLGVDKQLLSYRGFLEFRDSVEERIIEIEGNHYIINSDGILVVNVANVESFVRENAIDSIGVSLDSIALSDLDSIRGNSFKRYVKYLLDKCADDVSWVDERTLKAVINDKEKMFIIYHSHNTKRDFLSNKAKDKLSSFMEGRNGTLVTNLRIPQNMFNFPYVDRNDFERIAETNADRNVLRQIFAR